MKPTLTAWLIAGVLAPTAPGALVTVTISGTVQTGTDTSGVFVQKPAVLSNQPFTLVYIFDDTKGKQSIGTCSDGTEFTSSIDWQNAPSSPGTAVLSINGKSFSFGGSFGQSLYSGAMVNDSFLCGNGNSSARYWVQSWVQATESGGYSGGGYVGDGISGILL
jgi:hypothetical protein